MSVYEGKLPYIFISYAHKNNKAVMRVVDALERRGYRVWFDEGIAPGSEWPENIAQHLADSAVVIAFITRQSMESPNCRREIHFALSRKKPLLSIFLEETELPLGMELQLAAQQSILRYNHRTEEEFLEKICTSEMLQPCRISSAAFGGSPIAPPVSVKKRRSGALWIAAAAVCAAAVLAGGLFFRQSSRESAAADGPAISMEMPKRTEKQNSTTATAPAAVHMMRAAESLSEMGSSDIDENKAKPFWGQTVYARDQVQTVQFRGSLTGAPGLAWDVSAAGDRSILAWMEGSALCVAADGNIAVRDASFLFYAFENLESIDWGGCFTTDGTQSMRGMFYGCKNLKTLDVSFFDTSRSTDLSNMFRGCVSLTALDVSGFQTYEALDMYAMFYDCSLLTGLDVSGFRTENVRNMGYMFGKCAGLTQLDVSGFRTGNVTNMEFMFTNCSALTSLDLSGFRTDRVTNMQVMFYKCSSLTELNVSGFRTSAVTNMSWMFSGCSTLTALDVSGFDVSGVAEMKYMFADCSRLGTLDLSGFVPAETADFTGALKGCTALPASAIPEWYTGEI